MNDSFDPYRELANAIILQACTDYRNLLKRRDIKRPRIRGEIEVGLEECEKFFNSEWFELLTNIDGKALVEQIKKEVGYL